MKQYNVFTGEYDVVDENGNRYICKQCNKVLDKEKQFCNSKCEKMHIQSKLTQTNLEFEDDDESQLEIF